MKSLLLLRNCKFVVVLNGCFVILTTCAHVYFENTMLDIDKETRSVIYGNGIHTVSSYHHNIAWFKFRGADPQFTVRYYLVNNLRPTNLMFISFHFLFFVSFGNEVTKIWKYFVIFVYILQGKKSKMEIQRKENHEAKVTKKPKMKLPKYVMSWALVNSFKLFSSIFNYFSLDWNTFESLLWIPKLL